MTENNAFAAWLNALEIPTETIELCTDHRLVNRVAELHAQVEAEKAATDGDPDASLADAGAAEELAAARKAMAEKSIKLVVQAPSEDDMLGLEKLREKNSNEWVAAIIAAASHEPKLSVREVEQLRKRLDRGTWNTLFQRVLDIAVNRSLTVPFSSDDSGDALS